jgi:hypothetical protein
LLSPLCNYFGFDLWIVGSEANFLAEMHQRQENVLEATFMHLDLLLEGACGAFSFSGNICLFF